mmetsp:Transcript_19821/g.35364  ORF Transcript_19821/g.35364 Transcript_19821/m.35364 type:complete len:102 (-) Transcript_19821:369-674(-)
MVGWDVLIFPKSAAAIVGMDVFVKLQIIKSKRIVHIAIVGCCRPLFHRMPHPSGLFGPVEAMSDVSGSQTSKEHGFKRKKAVWERENSKAENKIHQCQPSC